jgi:hypothetical protein
VASIPVGTLLSFQPLYHFRKNSHQNERAK